MTRERSMLMQVDRDARESYMESSSLKARETATDVTVIAQSATFLVDSETGHRLLRLT